MMNTVTVEYFRFSPSEESIYMVWLPDQGLGLTLIRGHREARKRLINTLRDEGFKGILIFPHGKQKVTIK